MNKLKIQLDESKEKIKDYQDEVFSNSEKSKSLEEKLNGFKHNFQTTKNQLKEREIENKTLKVELASMSYFKDEKAKHEKTISELQKQVFSFKDDNE